MPIRITGKRAHHVLIACLILAMSVPSGAAQNTATEQDLDAVIAQCRRLEQLAISRLREGRSISSTQASSFSNIAKKLEALIAQQSNPDSPISVDEVEDLMDLIAELRLSLRKDRDATTSAITEAPQTSEPVAELEPEKVPASIFKTEPGSEAEETATLITDPKHEFLPEEAPITITVPTKTKLTVALREWMSTKEASTGDVFYVRVEDDVIALDDSVLIPERALFEGEVIEARGAGLLGRSGKLVLQLNKLLGPEGQLLPARARVIGLNRGQEIQGRTSDSLGEVAEEVAGSSAEEGLLGSGNTTRTAVGGGIDLVLGRGGDVFLRAGTELLVELDHELVIPWKWPEGPRRR